MKVFYINPQSYNNLSEYDCNLLSQMKNIEISYLCSIKLDREINNVHICKIFRYQKYHGIAKLLSYAISVIKVYLLIKKQKPDTIHIQWFKLPFFDIFFLKAVKKLGVKIIFTAHNILPHDTGKMYKYTYKKIYVIVDKVIIHDRNTKIEYMQQFPQSAQSEVIPHGLLGCNQRDMINNKVYNDNIIHVLFLGSINKYKGIDLFVNAILNNKQLQSNDFDFTIAGKGCIPRIEDLEKLQNVHLINRFLTNEEMMDAYGKTDISILPYRAISQSGVLLTNIGLHIPVIVSNIGGLSQPFEIQNIGYTLRDISEKSIYEQLVKAHLELDKIRFMKANEQYWESLDKFYSWVNIAKQTMRIYE